jgi:type I restriction enzyme, R subunit
MEKVASALKAEETAHAASGLSPQVYGIYKILEALRPATGKVAESKPGFGGNGGPDGADPLEQVAIQIDGNYGSDTTAPAGWHLKEQLRKELRQQVRKILHPTGLTGWKDELPARVEEYALKTYLKG